MNTLADKIIAFNRELDFTGTLPEGIRIMNPFREREAVMAISSAFYRKYYNDQSPRHLILGINPGRFGAGLTGIPFTDPKHLTENCGIPYPGPIAHEPSSVFVYEMIQAFGGVEAFYSQFYISAVCPLGFTKKLSKQTNLSPTGENLLSNGANLSSNGANLSTNGVNLSTNGVNLSSNGVNLSTNGVNLSSNGVNLSSSEGHESVSLSNKKTLNCTPYELRFDPYALRFDSYALRFGVREVNYNYYDSRELMHAAYDFIVHNLQTQLSFGWKQDICFCLGTGKNEKFLRALNDRYGFFQRIIALEHPRYIMQYKAKTKQVYIEKYLRVFRESL